MPCGPSALSRRAPPAASIMARVSAVAAGYAHTCALRSDVRVVCWCSNAYGQLGVGSTTDVGTSPAQLGNNLGPVNLGTGT